MSSSLVDSLARSRDFVRLSSNDEYAAYFRQLNRVFAFLITWYEKLVVGGNTEMEVVRDFLQRFLYTIEMLRLKHLYSSDCTLALDLNDSGFPHLSGIMELASSLALRPEIANRLPSRQVVQEMMLEEMLRRGRDPVDLLPLMAEIQLAERLDATKLISPFTPGKLIVVKNGHEEKDLITCLFSWLCYDPGSNMPCIHIMAFNYQGQAEQLREDYEQGDFLSVIRRYGNRISPMVVLASSIDQDLPRVSPKVLKRIQIGPIICPAFAAADDDDSLVDWIKRHGSDDDFALLLKAEAIFSKGEIEGGSSGWFSLGRRKQIQQIFAVSQFDPVATDHQASEVQQLIMLPHQVLQEVSDEPMFRDLYGNYQKVAYTREGGIYVF